MPTIGNLYGDCGAVAQHFRGRQRTNHAFCLGKSYLDREAPGTSSHPPWHLPWPHPGARSAQQPGQMGEMPLDCSPVGCLACSRLHGFRLPLAVGASSAWAQCVIRRHVHCIWFNARVDGYLFGEHRRGGQLRWYTTLRQHMLWPSAPTEPAWFATQLTAIVDNETGIGVDRQSWLQTIPVLPTLSSASLYSKLARDVKPLASSQHHMPAGPMLAQMRARKRHDA